MRVEPQRTPVTREELRSSIAGAYAKQEGHPASAKLLDVLTAHASLETGGGAQMYNFNFGGIKGQSPAGDTAMCRTHEVLGGKDVVVRDGFRAYRTLDEGATDYVAIMRGRFGAALEPAARGDVDGFAAALKKAHYYTASEKDYAAGLRGLVRAPPATHERVVRVADAVDAQRFQDLPPLAPHMRPRRDAEDDD